MPSYLITPFFCPVCFSNGNKSWFMKDEIIIDERGKPRCPLGHECRTRPRASKYRQNYIPSRL